MKQEWSPKAISRRLKKDYPLDMEMQISHEAIYRYLYVLPPWRAQTYVGTSSATGECIRHTRKTAHSTETRGKIAEMLSIEERPAEVEDRSVPGHWEGDLILEKYKRSALGPLVERTTRYTLLVPLGDKKDALSIREAFVKAFCSIPTELKKSLSYDQGKEMSERQRFTIDTGIQVYFAHPGSPWERGTNENTNGLIRHYFPKGTDFREVSVETIQQVQHKLNDCPRAVLDYLKPNEVFNNLVALKV